MKNFKIESTLWNRPAVISTLWSTIQQLMVAASTYFILQAIRTATNGDISLAFKYIIAFVVMLITLYAPLAFSTAYLQKWRLGSIDSFLTAFTKNNYGKTTLGHARNKVHSEAMLTNECFTVYEMATGLLYQLYSTFVNAALNILVIAFSLDVRILFWYLLAGAVLVGSNYAFKSKLTAASADLQSSRKNMSNVMLTAWDNIFVGNRHTFTNWNKSYTTRLEEAADSAMRYDVIRSALSSIAVVFALAVVAVGNGIFFVENAKKLPEMAALIVTLPRQIQIVQSIFAFFNLTLLWTGTKSQLKELEKAVLLTSDPNTSEKYVRFSDISLTGSHPVEAFNSVAEVKTILLREPAGRFTLRGRNGAGKSTLLSLLKENLGEKAFYLPTNYADLQFDSAFVGHSDGNRLITVFGDIKKLDDVQYVILDEWDANLDGPNIAGTSQAIEELAKSKVVIESRHRS